MPLYSYDPLKAGEIEAREESFSGVRVPMLVAGFGILAVLVLEFGSFGSMLIMFGVVPLGIVIIGGLIRSTRLARLVAPVRYKLLPPEIVGGNATAPSAGVIPAPAA